MASITVSKVTPDRPLVVLVGWLGCEPRSLRRYESLYRRMGWGVLTVIPPPTVVVSAATTDDDDGGGGSMTMRSLASDVLRAAGAVRCAALVFHVFSNSGAFLWERSRELMFPPVQPELDGGGGDDDDASAGVSAAGPRTMPGFPVSNSTAEERLRSKLVGVVFDSSPAFYSGEDGSSLDAAMRHCGTRDRLSRRLAELWARGWEVGPLLSSSRAREERRSTERRRRAEAFWAGLRDCPCDAPHLYLYGEGDPLAPSGPLRELVDHRRRAFGNRRVFSRRFVGSQHCSHLRAHPEKYEAALGQFLDCCCRQTRCGTMLARI